jgi:hypothetical protein
MRHTARILATSALALGMLAPAAHAFTLSGTIKNGTTGAVNLNLKVVAIQPSAGMKEVGATDAKNGAFVLENMPDAAPMVMLKVEYAGITYNTTVPVTGGNQNVAVEVFEPTKSWDGVNVIVPHLAVTRRGDALFVEQLYEITNESSPPKTVGAFEMWLPSDMDSIQDCYVISGEVPLKRVPTPTDTKDVYTIDYPIRPGMTRIGISYALPYKDNMYTMRARYPVPVAHMMVFAVDSSMQVTTTSHEFVSTQSVHGMSAYALHGMEKGQELILNFVGGNPDFAGLNVEDDGHNHAAEGTPDNIRVAPTDDYKISIFVMITVLLVLTGIVGMALRDRHDPLSDAKVLRAHYDLLVARLAKLDDLHAANTIPSDAYRATREELVGRLAALAMQLRAHGGVHARNQDAPAVPKTKVQ